MNVDFVGFVSSIGKIYIPSSQRLVASTSTASAPNGLSHTTSSIEQDEDASEELMSEDYLNLLNTVTREQIDASPVRCPDEKTTDRMVKRILRAKAADDSIGGTVTCVIRNMPTGLGEPCFDKLEAKLAHAMLSIPATKGFEIGSGFNGCEVAGSAHNDAFVRKADGSLGTITNRSGGIQGGISNGENVYFKYVLADSTAGNHNLIRLY